MIRNMKAVRGEASAMGTLFLAIAFMLVLGGVWIYSGGPSRTESHSGPFLGLPWPLGGGGAYSIPGFSASTTEYGLSGTESGSGSGSPQAPSVTSRFGFGTITADSPYAGKVTLKTWSARETDPKREYLSLETRYGLDKNFTITGWSLVNSSGTVVKIGQGSDLPFLGAVNAQGPITMGPGTTVELITGRSPNGTSFRLNQCTGYFEQHQDFTPSLPLECPSAGDEFNRLLTLNQTNDACDGFVRTIGRCQFVGAAPPVDIGSACQNLVLNILSYNGCINIHKNDPGFYKNSWRVYLGRDQELWKNTREEIRLLDENGKVIDVVGY